MDDEHHGKNASFESKEDNRKFPKPFGPQDTSALMEFAEIACKKSNESILKEPYFEKLLLNENSSISKNVVDNKEMANIESLGTLDYLGKSLMGDNALKNKVSSNENSNEVTSDKFSRRKFIDLQSSNFILNDENVSKAGNHVFNPSGKYQASTEILDDSVTKCAVICSESSKINDLHRLPQNNFVDNKNNFHCLKRNCNQDSFSSLRSLKFQKTVINPSMHVKELDDKNNELEDNSKTKFPVITCSESNYNDNNMVSSTQALHDLISLKCKKNINYGNSSVSNNKLSLCKSNLRYSNVYEILQNIGKIKELVCEQCHNIWNDHILKMLFEGSTSVTVKSRITCGAIICMNIFVYKNYPQNEEHYLTGLLERADLGENLGFIHVSSLFVLLVQMIQNSNIQCCQPFKPIYKKKIRSLIYSLDNKFQSEGICLLTENSSKLGIQISTKGYKNNNNKMKLGSALVGSDLEDSSGVFDLKLKIISFEKKNISPRFLKKYEDIKFNCLNYDQRNFRMRNFSYKEIEKIYQLFFPFKESQDYYIFHVQILNHRGISLLIPDSMTLKICVQNILPSLKIYHEHRLNNNWDPNSLYTADISYSSSPVPTIRNILAFFCLWRNRCMLAKSISEDYINGALMRLFPKDVVIEDFVGLCVRLYDRYCEMVFEKQRISDALIFLNSHYLPHKNLKLINNKFIITDEILHSLHCDKVFEGLSYIEGDHNVYISAKLHKILINKKIEIAHMLESNIFSSVQDSLSSDFHEYAQLRSRLEFLKSHCY